MSECPNASEPNFALTQCDFQFHYNLWVIRAHQDIRPYRRALSYVAFAYLCPEEVVTYMHESRIVLGVIYLGDGE